MAEISPTTAELNALSDTTDAATGVAIPTKGAGLDWFPDFAEFAWRLFKAFKSSGELRVFKDGDLTYGVRAGLYMYGDNTISYAGSTGNAVTDDATNYVYLTATGTLTINITGFPNPSATPHIPLAVLIAAATEVDLTNITDYRGRAIWSVPGAVPALLDNIVYFEETFNNVVTTDGVTLDVASVVIFDGEIVYIGL